MSTNRIQKLLFSEYSDFNDMVLVESPFAQTTREGKGIRQINLGLTPTKLVVATDFLPPATESSLTYFPGVDPDIETFELVAVYPVECLNLSIFHRRRRQSLKAHFCNNRVLYFELGGFEKRQMFWNLWCERVKFLSPEDPGSSHSETSVATSTSNSTLYLLASRKVVTKTGVPQLWYKFGGGDVSRNIQRWSDRSLYMGKQLDESPLNYNPVMVPPSISQFVSCNRQHLKKTIFSLPTSNSNNLVNIKLSGVNSHVCPINRFGKGVPEGCTSGLFLPVDTQNVVMKPNFSMTSTESAQVFTLHSVVKPQAWDYTDLTERAVRVWELARDTNPNVHIRGRHRRRYGFGPQPHFLHGLGPWSVPPGERFSVQVKRAVSAVGIRRQPLEPELRLPVSRRQLVASISCEALNFDSRLNANANTIKTALKRPVVFFWTPEYWYRPRSAKDAYHELQSHLSKVREYCQCKNKERKKDFKLQRGKRRLFRRNKTKQKQKEILISDSEELSEDTKQTKKSKRRNRNTTLSKFSKVNYEESTENIRKPEETSLQYLRRILRIDVALTAWDFDSSTLACQLTLTDRDLVLKIPSIELGVLLWQQTSKNAPNIGALEAFSHRISCLVATEVLRDDSEKIRARLIARFINTAEKCHKLANFQSCRSILCGLQSPAIYRLHVTWTYVRKRHATKYQVFENLCRVYRDPRLPSYQKSFFAATQSGPYLLFMGDLLARLLNRVPSYGWNFTQVACTKKTTKSAHQANNAAFKSIDNFSQTHSPSAGTMRKILSTLRVLSLPETCCSDMQCYKKNLLTAKLTSYDEDNMSVRLNNAIEVLEQCQKAAVAYVFRKNELAKDYLLKARYREDRENFFNSFSVERQHFVEGTYVFNFE